MISTPSPRTTAALLFLFAVGLLPTGCSSNPTSRAPSACDECCHLDFKRAMYAQQCPGYQSLNKLEQLHVKLSLGNKKKSQCNCCPPPASFQSGGYSALVITRFVDKELVKCWLPDGLMLDPDCPFGEQHPVIILCGEQRDFARTTGDKTQYPLWGRHFHEVFISIPYLKLTKSPEKQSIQHFVRVYADSWPATYLGLEKGWAKLCVPVESNEGCYEIRNCNQQLLFKSQTDYCNPQRICESSNPSFTQVRAMLEMPMALHKPTSEGYRIVDFDLRFECAKVKSVSSQVCINNCFLPGLPATQEYIPGINDADYGAFHMNAHFTAKKMKY